MNNEHIDTEHSTGYRKETIDMNPLKVLSMDQVECHQVKIVSIDSNKPEENGTLDSQNS